MASKEVIYSMRVKFNGDISQWWAWAASNPTNILKSYSESGNVLVEMLAGYLCLSPEEYTEMLFTETHDFKRAYLALIRSAESRS